jgi:DNA-binding NtrC family response regulator
MADILVVDDEIGIRELLSEILGDEGHEVLQAENAAQARSARAKGRPDLVLLDIWMPDTDGIALLREWSEAGLLTMPVIMMSGHATVEMASQATRLGAIGFLEKPIALQKLLTAVQNGLQGKTARPITSQGSLQPAANAPSQVASATVFKASGVINANRAADQALESLEGEAPLRSADSLPKDADVQQQASAAYAPLGLESGSGLQGAPHIDTSSQARQGSMASPWALSSQLERDNALPQARLAFLSFDQPLRDARDAFERLYFEHHLAREGGSMTRVAERTGLERTHLYRKLKQLGVELGRSPRREV